jgi:hypothetical protein
VVLLRSPLSQIFRYPSPALPPFAAFEIELPDGWVPDEAPECLAIFVDPAATAFRVNLLVSADRVGADVELEDVAAATLEEATHAFADFEVEQEKVSRVAGQAASLRFQSFAVDGVEGRLLQLQVLLFAPSDGRSKTRDLFHVDGTCLAEDASTYAPLFVSAAQSLRFV